MFSTLLRRMLRAALAVFLALWMGAACAEGQVIQLPVDDSAGLPVNDAFYLDDWHYEDPSIKVSIEKHHWVKSDCYVARITIQDPAQLRTSSAYGFDRKQVAAVQDMAERMNAVLAINGDYCYYQLSTATCYLVRQGTLYADLMAKGRDMLLIDDKGDFTIVQACTKKKLEEAMQGMNLINSFSFGPGLIVNGEKLDDGYHAKFNGSEGRHQRAAIAQVEKGKLEYICAVSEGNYESEGGGLTMTEWADFLMTLGVENAYNLDGGNSAALIFRHAKLNAAENQRHRKLSDIIYFASAYQE